MIEIKNVTFSYAGIKKSGIKNISLSVKQGECILLCGASGCGKTTLTRLINGLIPHFFKGELKGEVIVKDKKIEEQQLYNLAGLVGSVFQNPRSQFFSVDTDGEITFGAENIGLSKAEILKRKRAVVKELNLQSLMGRSLFDLSGGEKQKIACGSVAELLPEIIILDEPSSNLDRESILELREMMKLWKGKGKTLIISEHRLWYVKDVIDRAVFMEEGEIKGEWSRKEFNALSEEELISYELRPVSFEKVEEKFYFKENTVSTENKSFPGEIYLKDFYFTYNPKKYLFFSKKLTPEDEKICNIRIPKLKVKKGEIIGVIGRNGSGKSTFLRCLCGLEKSCIGSVIIDGVTYKGKGLTKLCYMVMQDVNHQLFTDSVISEVMLSMKNPDANPAEEILKSLDLYEYRDDHPMALSGGQKQRVAIASALAAFARILLFDEPTSGLDYRHMCEVADLLKRLALKGNTIFVSTHDPELIRACCSRVVEIKEGYLINRS